MPGYEKTLVDVRDVLMIFVLIFSLKRTYPQPQTWKSANNTEIILDAYCCNTLFSRPPTLLIKVPCYFIPGTW